MPSSLSTVACKSTFITFVLGWWVKVKLEQAIHRSHSHIDCCWWFSTIFLSPFSCFFQQHCRSISVRYKNQSSVATGHPLQWQAQNEKHSRPWHIELGAKHQQVVLSPCCGPWALEWNGQRSSLLWDEWRRQRCFWSGWVAEYWGVKAKAETRGSTCPTNFTVEVRSSP